MMGDGEASLSPPSTSDGTAAPGIRLDFTLPSEKNVFVVEETMTAPEALSLRDVPPGG